MCKFEPQTQTKKFSKGPSSLLNAEKVAHFRVDWHEIHGFKKALNNQENLREEVKKPLNTKGNEGVNGFQYSPLKSERFQQKQKPT